MKSQKIERKKRKPFAYDKSRPCNAPPIYYPRPGRRTFERGWLRPSDTCANPKVRFLASKAGFYLSLLHEYAVEGDVEALSELSDMIETVVGRLNGLKPEFVRQVARKRVLWPVLAGQHPLQIEAVSKALTALQVGEETEWKKQARWGVGWGGGLSVASREAICLVGLLKANARLGRVVTKADWRNWPQWAKACCTLPTLTKDTAANWFEIGWQAILEETNSRPEDVPELRALGEYRAKHSERAGQQKRATPRTAAVNIRARIKERIAQALHSLALSGNTPA